MAGATLYLGTADGVVTLAVNGSPKVETHALKGWSVEEVAVDPSAQERVLAGARGDGVWVSDDRGAGWKKPSYGRIGPGKVRCLTIDPANPKRVYAGGEPIEIYVTEDQGAHWEKLDSVRALPFIENIDYPLATVEPHIRDIAIDPLHTDTIYAALQVGGMIKSTDGGKTWQHIEEGVDCDIHTIVVDADHTHVIIVATGGNYARSGKVQGRALYRSADGGQTWSPIAMQWEQEYSVPLVPNPANPHTLYSALANGAPPAWRRESGAEAVIIKSTNGGKEWSELPVGLPEAKRDFPRAIAVDPGETDTVYVGFGGGIIVSKDAGATWSRLDVEVPSINDLKCVRV